MLQGRAHEHAAVFSAMGDETRLALIAQLASGERRSITELSESSTLTRQAVTKHLRVLEGAGIVRSYRSGRLTLFELDPQPIREANEFLDVVSEQWDRKLAELKRFVEE
ncbi:MAG TPA: metalloregulator ArsR/SmtB family transcription factor [Trueperaceae bacterium]